ncbi:MAG: NAD(P)H-hydrate dehydratase [Candidatus Heimdallarchaeaceae archaeon]
MMQKREFYSIKEIRALEDNAFSLDIPVIQLMENAGKSVAEEIMNIPQITSETTLIFFCGYGNNGGDALVAARYLTKQNYTCKIVLVGKKEKFNSFSAQKNFLRLNQLLPKERWFRIRTTADFEEIRAELEKDAWIVDGLLGIGVKGEPREPMKSVIDYINLNYNNRTISIDIASGYDPLSENKTYIKEPAKIVCLGRNKVKTSDFPNTEVIVKPIGIPPEAEQFVGIGDLKWLLPKREEESHKGQNGIIWIIGGSEDYIGAPSLSAFGAFRTGADLVYILIPEDIRGIIASFSPDFITIPGNKKELMPTDIENLLIDKRLDKATIIIGPGMKNDNTTRMCVRKLLLSEKEKKIVIDAGALSTITEEELKLMCNHLVVLTPHTREFERIFDVQLPEDLALKKVEVEQIAAKWNITILLKGHTDIISNGEQTKYNRTGHPGMTVGGTGDVLTGIVGTLLYILSDPFTAAYLGAYISGKAGEFASLKYGDGIMASDIPHFINQVITEARNFKPREE